MATRRNLIKCSNCGQILEDTGQPKVTCRYCGTVTDRSRLGKEADEVQRRVLVKTLTATISRNKTIKLVSFGIAAVFLIVATVFLLFETGYEAPILELTFLIMLFVSGGVWFLIGRFYAKQLEHDKSKMFDITGGRTIDYKY